MRVKNVAASELRALWRHRAIVVRTVIGLLLVLPLGLFLFAWSGLYNIAASRGHFAIVHGLLEFGMNNSVELHAAGIAVPDLDRPDLILLGANHYRSGCAPCHGAPGLRPNPIAQSALPAPPDLTFAIRDWKDNELFWIVKNGIKYTGMPAWVAQERDDEVWALVAFLKVMRRLDAADYAALIGRREGEARSDIAREAAAACAGCHGDASEGPRSALVPALQGQKRDYLVAALDDYARGRRGSGFMQPVASDLSARDIAAFAAFYAQLPPPPAPPDLRPASDIALGRTLAMQGQPAAGIPACDACHAATGLPVYPLLAGQSAAYLAGQLRLWKHGQRRRQGASAIMAPIAERLSDAQIEAVSAYYATLPAMRSAR